MVIPALWKLIVRAPGGLWCILMNARWLMWTWPRKSGRGKIEVLRQNESRTWKVEGFCSSVWFGGFRKSSKETWNIHSFSICSTTPHMATIDYPYDNGPRKSVKTKKPFVRKFKSPVRFMKRWSTMDWTGSFLIFNYRKGKQNASRAHARNRGKPVESVSWKRSYSRWAI